MLLSIFLLLLFLLISSSRIGSPFTYSANQKYAYISRSYVNASDELQQTGISYYSPSPFAMLTIPLPESFKTVDQSQIKFALVLGELKYIQNYVDVFLFGGINSGSISISIYSPWSSGFRLQKLTIQYLVFYESTSTFQIYRDGNYFDYRGTYISLTNPNQFIVNCISSNDLAGNVNIPLMLSGITATADSSQRMDFNIIALAINRTSVLITITSQLTTNTWLKQVQFCLFLFDQVLTNTQHSSKCHFYSGKISFQSGTAVQFKSNNKITNINTLVGLKSFTTYNISSFSFYVSINESNGIMITSDAQSGSMAMTFTYLVIQSLYCDFYLPYFQEYSQSCVSECPGNTTKNDVLLTCGCIVGNQTVNNSLCMVTQSAQNSKNVGPDLGFIIGTALVSIFAFAIILIVVIKCIRRNQGQKRKSKEGIYSKSVQVPNVSIHQVTGLSHPKILHGNSQSFKQMDLPVDHIKQSKENAT